MLLVRSNHLRIGVLVLTLLSLFFHGCASVSPAVAGQIGAAVVGGIGTAIDRQREVRQKELEDKQIGYQSSPVTVPRVGELRLLVFPLNANDRRGIEPFVICLAARWTTGESKEKPQTLSIDAKTISLILPDGSAIKPSGYAVEAICPYFDLLTSSTRTLAYREIDFGQPLAWNLNPSISWGFPDLALRFDVATPGAEQKFSLQLGSLALDGALHNIPIIAFTSYYGKIPRVR